ncbi:hypothetical protein ACTQ49_04040 [Luteococcus sp. Sow4_B9]|uniref:hypothetical protein n=1 Tax=Luteococcus sp. Sow4_B9 TaxID=3438792 RepID=UPI003F94C702
MPTPDHRSSLDARTAFTIVLSDAIAQRNLTLERISQHLKAAGTPVSIATLSYWQTGRSLPTRARSIRVLQELETILRVPRGHLTGALPTDAISRWDPITALPHNEQAASLLKALDFPTEPSFTNQLIHDSVAFSARDHRQEETTRHLLRADRAGLRRLPLLLAQDVDSQETPLVEGMMGCELGEVVQLDQIGLMLAEVLFPHPLERGELAMLEYRVSWNIEDETRFGSSRALATTIPFLVLDVTFTDETPSRVWYASSQGPDQGNGPDESPSGEEVTALEPGPFAQMALSNGNPGLHRLRWEF